MGKPQVGILVDETGVSSVALLAAGEPARRAAKAIYECIAIELETFDRRIGQRLRSSAAPSNPEALTTP